MKVRECGNESVKWEGEKEKEHGRCSKVSKAYMVNIKVLLKYKQYSIT